MKKTLLLVSLVAAGCADDVPEGSLLERTRVLAIAARPEGDPTRAWPRPGEATRLDWLVAGPGALPPMSWSATVCAVDPLGCSPVYEGSGSGPPDLRFVAPDAERLLVLARVAPDGEPETVLAFDLPVERGEPNHHPRSGEVALAGAAWGAADCPPVAAGGEDVELRVSTHAADRERYLTGDGKPARESLRLSFFATAGELDGQFRVVESGDPDETDRTIKWTPPARADVPDGGLQVRFTFVVRDLRGGIDWTTRTLCVGK